MLFRSRYQLSNLPQAFASHISQFLTKHQITYLVKHKNVHLCMHVFKYCSLGLYLLTIDHIRVVASWIDIELVCDTC